jgi:hypothetical protein
MSSAFVGWVGGWGGEGRLDGYQVSTDTGCVHVTPTTNLTATYQPTGLQPLTRKYSIWSSNSSS